MRYNEGITQGHQEHLERACIFRFQACFLEHSLLKPDCSFTHCFSSGFSFLCPLQVHK